jgi:hypothetical protein
LAASLRQGEWWNPFAPTDFEACSEQAAISAKSVAALNILLNSCHSKFKGRRKDGGGYTYFDERQKRHFDISGPILMADEVRYIDLEYESYTAKAAELERRQQIEQAEVERVSRLREAEAERRDNTRRIELENRRKATATAIRLSAIQVNCHYPSLRDCVQRTLRMRAFRRCRWVGSSCQRTENGVLMRSVQRRDKRFS